MTIFLGHATTPNIVAPLLAIVAQSTSATAMIVTGTQVFPANSLRVGDVWRLTAAFVFVHTAAVTPQLAFSLDAFSASFVVTCIPVATAGTYNGEVEAYFTVRTLGSGTSASVARAIHVRCPGLNAANGGSKVDPATVLGFDSTAATQARLGSQMTTAVAGNSLTFSQGFVEQICHG